jgi:hypothetical protein
MKATTIKPQMESITVSVVMANPKSEVLVRDTERVHLAWARG